MNMNSESLLQALQTYAQQGWAAFHMPGHKRNSALLGDALPYQLDITEIAGFDNMHHPNGILLALAQRAAAFWGSSEAWLSVNGSTAAILAGLRAMTRPGDTVLAARNCHISVFHGLELCGLRAVFLEPEWLPEWGFYGAVTQETLDAALLAHPEAALCVVTSPSYEGILSPLRCPVPLFTDAAHGAHLPLPEADLAAISLHKTLPALTQTAVLHACSARVDRERIAQEMRVFQTSSPSYVLLASAGHCLELLEANKVQWFDAWQRRLHAFYAHARTWRNLRLYDASGTVHDKSKLLLRCHAQQAAALLRSHKIEPEYARENLLLLMTSCCDTDEAMERLTAALDALDAQALPLPAPAARPAALPNTCIQVPHAVETIPAKHAAGRICAQYVAEYPPGVPLCIPGQRITGPQALGKLEFVRVAVR